MDIFFYSNKFFHLTLLYTNLSYIFQYLFCFWALLYTLENLFFNQTTYLLKKFNKIGFLYYRRIINKIIYVIAFLLLKQQMLFCLLILYHLFLLFYPYFYYYHYHLDLIIVLIQAKIILPYFKKMSLIVTV